LRFDQWRNSRRLATKAEAQKWFNVKPESSANVVTLPADQGR